MSSTVPYIGSKISLVSNSEIRYEGILYTINTQESTIALQAVRCFGTEGRKIPEIPPSSEVYDFIIFRGQDIKDLTVLESSSAVKDPAIVSINQRPQGKAAEEGRQKGGSGDAPGGSKGGDKGGGKGGGGKGASRDSGYGNYNSGGGNWSGGGGSQWWDRGGNNSWSGGWGGWSGGWGGGGGGRGDSGKGGKADSGKGKAADSGKGAKGKESKGKGPADSKGGKAGGGKAGGKTDSGKGKGGDSKGAKGKGGDSGGRRGGKGGGGGGGGGNSTGISVGELQPEENAAVKRECAEEFDVAGANDKFEKVNGTEGVEDKMKPLAGYDKSKSFFDNISCEASERAADSERVKMDRDKARQFDKETFGDTQRPPRPSGGRPSKGRRRGGGPRGYRS